MKHNHLKEAVLLGLAMEMAACTTGMAEEKINGPITDGSYNGTYSEKVTITNADPKEAAINLDKKKDGSIVTKTFESSDDGYDIVLNSAGSGIKANNGASVTLESSENNEIWFNTDDGSKGNGIIVKEDGRVYLQAADSNKIQGKNEKGDGIQFNANTSTMAEVGLNAVNNTIIVAGDGIHDQYDEDKDLKSQGSIILTATTGSNTIDAGQNGINHEGQNTITLEAEAGNNDIEAVGHGIYLEGHSSGTVALSGKGNTISSTENSGIYITEGSEGTVSITANGSGVEGISNTVTGKDGIHAEAGSVEMQAAAGTNVIQGEENQENNGIYDKDGTVSLNGYKNEVSGGTGIQVESGKVSLEATGNNEVTGHANYGITAQAGTVDLISKATNVVSGGNIITPSVEMRNAVLESFGDGYAVHASGKSEQEQTKVTFSAADQNQFFGAVYASGNASVEMGFDQYIGGGSMGNYVASAAVISEAGDLNQDTATDNNMSKKQVISALYAEDGAAITVSGQSNTFRTTANPNNSNQLERVIWAYNGADITVDGTTTISTDSYKESPNSADIAIAAGTAVNLTKDAVDYAVANPDNIDHAVVTVNYDSYADNEGNTMASSITGDIVSAYAGQVNIKKQDGAAENAKINIEGNLLAGNGGSLQVDLGKGGLLTGRVDDYGDAGSTDEKGEFTEGHATFFDPAFSSTIYKGGNISLDMGDGSVWDVTGQSWLTSLSGNGTIDMRNTTEGDSSHAVHIHELSGDHTFIMDLNADQHDISDMLYIYDTAENSTQKVQFKNITGWEGMEDGEKLRFATVNANTTELKFTDANATQITYLRDLGVNDMGFEIQNEKVTFTDESKDEENEGYNGESLNGDKPGNASVEENYNQANSLNWYLIKNSAEDTLSDAGQTVIDMSRVNYSNAVYMDRLNKRMGEARYIEGDDGLWVRLRHDRIGKEDAFRSMNTMFELGYDRKVQAQKDGEHRRGVAFDYMRGEANYTNVMGSGDVRRAGVWLYDTWLGDKGHYSDYVVKYGRLSNDFDIFARTSGNKISGDYDNDVWSASAEYGRKKDIGNEWYFEPQAQLQYAYVTSADYTTSQETRVELDGIDSLIGRAGFRLGRDTSEGNTVYFKADILHEFLGDQSIRAMDDTGVLSTTYDNEGTWYDVGLGFSHRMGEDSYMFLDVEHSFGNDNEDTYQINIGLNKAF